MQVLNSFSCSWTFLVYLPLVACLSAGVVFFTDVGRGCSAINASPFPSIVIMAATHVVVMLTSHLWKKTTADGSTAPLEGHPHLEEEHDAGDGAGDDAGDNAGDDAGGDAGDDAAGAGSGNESESDEMFALAEESYYDADHEDNLGLPLEPWRTPTRPPIRRSQTTPPRAPVKRCFSSPL